MHTPLSLQPKSWTSLFDAICLAVSRRKKVVNRNKSRSAKLPLRRESDVLIYTIGRRKATPVTCGGMRSSPEPAADADGRISPLSNLKELPNPITKISAALHAQRILGSSRRVTRKRRTIYKNQSQNC